MKFIEKYNEAGKLKHPYVLIVDDERTTRHVLQTLIMYYFPQCIVDTASDGYEALRMFLQKYYNIIVLDIAMPKLNGKQTLERIKKLCILQKINEPYIVLCTAYENSLDNTVNSDVKFSFLPKPFSDDQVINILSKYILL